MISAFNNWLHKRHRREQKEKNRKLREEFLQGILEAFDYSPPRRIYLRASSGSLWWFAGSDYDRAIRLLDSKIVQTPYFDIFIWIDTKVPYMTFHVGDYRGSLLEHKRIQELTPVGRT